MPTCPSCHQSNVRATNFCIACGASLAEEVAREREADEVEGDFLLLPARRARTWLFIVAFLQLAAGAWLLAIGRYGLPEAIVEGVIALVFAGLALWCRSNPFAATVTALALFTLLHGLIAVVEPQSILRGLILKIIVIGVLVKAIAAAVRHRAFVRERGLA